MDRQAQAPYVQEVLVQYIVRALPALNQVLMSCTSDCRLGAEG